MCRLLIIALLIGQNIFHVDAQQPKNSMDTVWNLFKNNLKEKLPLYYSRINAPCSRSEIEKLESKLEIKLPQEVVELYMANNGEDESWFVGGIMCGTRMLTLDGILKEWASLKAIEEEYNFNAKWRGEIYPANSIKPAAFNEKWIPIFSDDNGNFIGIDMAPGPNGKQGQVINFGTDEYDHFVIAGSLTGFIAFINLQFENGNADKAIFLNEDGHHAMFGLTVESHLTDDLRTVVKTKAGNGHK